MVPLPFTSVATRSSLLAKAPAASKVTWLLQSFRDPSSEPDSASDRELPVVKRRPAAASAFHTTPSTDSRFPYSNVGSALAPSGMARAQTTAGRASDPFIGRKITSPGGHRKL